MKIFVSFLFALEFLSSLVHARAHECSEDVWSTKAEAFLRSDAPKGSSVELRQVGSAFEFSVRHKKNSGEYSKTGTLEVKSASDGGCLVKVIESQMQVHGNYDFSSSAKTTAKIPFIDLSKIAGIWISVCIQTQSDDRQGFMLERYTLKESKEIELKRAWFKDGTCKGKSFFSENEKGTFEVGKVNTNNGFNPPETREAVFEVKGKKDLGLIWINADYSQMRLSRGLGSSQNTLLSLTQYRKL